MRFAIIENSQFLTVEMTNVGCFLNKGHENSFRSDGVDRVAEEAVETLQLHPVRREVIHIAQFSPTLLANIGNRLHWRRSRVQ